jgi:hypothetical protein
MLNDVCLEVNPVGKPDAVAPHVRFDERGRETGLQCYRARPRLYRFPRPGTGVSDLEVWRSDDDWGGLRAHHRRVERKTTESGQSDPWRPAAEKIRAVSEIPLDRWKLAELILVGRGQLREGGIGRALGNRWWGVRPGYGPGVGEPQAQMLENLPDHHRVMDEGNHLHAAATCGALQRVHFIHPRPLTCHSECLSDLEPGTGLESPTHDRQIERHGKSLVRNLIGKHGGASLVPELANPRRISGRLPGNRQGGFVQARERTNASA